MLFPTVEFGVFFLIVFIVSWMLVERSDARKVFLLAASYVFYGWWDWRFCGLLALSSLGNYVAGRLLGETSDERARKIIVGVAVFANLAVLAAFKYLGWFLESLSDALIAVGLERDIPLFELILPVGISFFTFQGISYVVDVYRKEIEPERSPVEIALYISFFPQLVAGPIIRASKFLPQLKQKPDLSEKAAAFGMVLIVVGLFKKMIVANYLAVNYVDQVFFDPESYGSLDLLFGSYAYAVQIYCDFSGYSDIAIGVAALLGYRFHANFNQPYRAASLQDFWRRWHISLSTWLRDYLYIPLGGSRGGTFKTYRNLLITMLLGGIWHGAAWTFVIWGAIHGLVLAIERALSGLFSGTSFPNALKVLAIFHIVCLAWIFFRAENLEVALVYLDRMTSLNNSEIALSGGMAFLIVSTLAFQFAPPNLLTVTADRFAAMGLGLKVLIFTFAMLCIQWLAPEGVAPFIYFRF